MLHTQVSVKKYFLKGATFTLLKSLFYFGVRPDLTAYLVKNQGVSRRPKYAFFETLS